MELQSSRSGALCYLSAGGGLVPGLQSYLLAGAGRSSPGGSSVPADSPPSQPPTEEELEEDYYGNAVHPGLYQHIYGHTGNPYSEFMGPVRNQLAPPGPEPAGSSGSLVMFGYFVSLLSFKTS